MAMPTLVAVAVRGEPKEARRFTVISCVVMMLVRRVVGDRERRAQIAERERDLVAREAVVEERARIARELHDVIAHHVSMIVLQAGAERRILDDANASTREVLETVERNGPQRANRDAPSARHAPWRRERTAHAPARGSRTCPVLVSQLREAGLPVELRSKASDASCRSASSCRPTGSCKRH